MYEYFDEAVDRVVAMLLEVSALFDPPVKRIIKNLDPTIPDPPIWLLYPGGTQPEDLAVHLERQTFLLNMRLVTGLAGQGYKGEVASKLWLWLPTVLNYFRQRKALVYQAGQKPIRYLDVPNVRIRLATPYGVFTSQNHYGIEFQLALPFTLALKPYPGN